MTIILTVGSAFTLSLLLTPLAGLLARRAGLVDRPDSRRKLHREPIPTAGGLAVLVSVVIAGGGALTWLTFTQGGPRDLGPLWGLLAGGVAICALGVADDYNLLRGRHKLLGQLLIAGLLIASGARIDTVHFLAWDVELGLLAVPFTAFFLLACINSLNLLDGMDGMLGTVGLIATSALAVMAALNGHLETALVACALAGALAGFLCFNLPPASIFLGDAGSMLIGLAVGVLAIRSALKGPATVALAAPTALLLIPILDTGAAILRRKLTGRSLYTTDRGHFHHCLLRRGWPVSKVLVVTSACCLVTGVAALVSVWLNNELLALVSALAVAAMLVSRRVFGYAEFLLVWQRFGQAARSLLKTPPPKGGRESQVRLQGAFAWQDLWELIIEGGHALNVHHIQLDVNAPSLHEGYHARWDGWRDRSEEQPGWRVEMPLFSGGHAIGRVTFTGGADETPNWEKMQTLAEVLRQCDAPLAVLTEKISAITEPDPVTRPPAGVGRFLARSDDTFQAAVT